jgi:hypothetical protein
MNFACCLISEPLFKKKINAIMNFFRCCAKSPQQRPYNVSKRFVSSVNKSEVEKFSGKEIEHFFFCCQNCNFLLDLAKNWWNVEGPLKTLHHINPTRVKFIRNYLETKTKSHNSAKPFEELNVLDVGCGAGILSEVYRS